MNQNKFAYTVSSKLLSYDYNTLKISITIYVNNSDKKKDGR